MDIILKDVRAASEVVPWGLEICIDDASGCGPRFSMYVTFGMGRGALDLVLWKK